MLQLLLALLTDLTLRLLLLQEFQLDQVAEHRVLLIEASEDEQFVAVQRYAELVARS